MIQNYWILLLYNRILLLYIYIYCYYITISKEILLLLETSKTIKEMLLEEKFSLGFYFTFSYVKGIILKNLFVLHWKQLNQGGE